MPRTIDATLTTAMLTDNYDVAFQIIYSADTLVYTWQPSSFKLSGTKLTAKVRGNGTQSAQAFNPKKELKLKRTITVNGTPYTVETSKFFVTSWTQQIVTEQAINTSIETTFEASLLSPNRINIAGDGTYQATIALFATAIGRTYTLKTPGAAYWQYQFLPTGKSYTTNNAENFLSMLASKYFIYAADNQNGDILFYAALETGIIVQTTIPSSQPVQFTNPYNQTFRLMARDENSTIRYQGNAADPIHNIGFLKSTQLFPDNTTSPGIPKQLPLYSLQREPVNLTYLDGDETTEDNIYGSLMPIVIEEIYDPKASPTWHINISQLKYFHNTDGGAMPSTIERVAAYTPLVTTGFNNNLDATVNNLQALADAVDDLPMITNVFTRLLTQNLIIANTQCLVIANYIDADAFDIILEGDADLMIL